jgi:glycosyltransferase involved in cell wall biosynthesis
VLFGRARVVVTPYRRASQSGVVHLAYTFDRPVVASAVGDIPDVVDDGATGLLVPPDDPAALADALVRLLTDAEEADRMGAAGARWLAREASWERVAERVEEGLQKAAVGPDVPRP